MLHLDSFDVSDLLGHVQMMTREAVRRRGTILVIEREKEAGWMVGDAVRLKQTLFHLISGALKTLAGDRITLSAERSSGEVVFAVRHTARSEARGLGLGIYLAQRIAELHGGALELAVEADESVVRCRLPAGGAASQAASGS